MNAQNTHAGANFEMRSLIKDITKNIWAIIFAGIIAWMGLYIYQFSLHKPEYKSTAMLAVRSKVGSGYTELSTAYEMTNVFTEVFKQPAMKQLAAKNLGLDSFDGTIDATVQRQTNIMVISVTADRPEKAYLLLDSVLDVYPEISGAVFSNSVIDILSNPKMPVGASNNVNSTKRTQIIFLAMLLQSVLIVLLSILRNTIKNENSFKSRVDSKLVGTVTHEKLNLTLKEKMMGKKRALLIDDAYTSLKFSEEYQRIANKIEYAQTQHGYKVFTVTSVAENEGKSTASVNISLALAARGYKVALLDLDVRKPSIYKIFDFKGDIKVEFPDVLSGKAKMEDFRFYRYRNSSLLLALNKTSRNDSVNWLSSHHSVECIESIKEQMDFVIIDTPPIAVSADAVQLTTLADRTLLVVRTDRIAAEDINDAILSVTNSGGEIMGCILNDVYKSFTLFGQIGADEDKYYHYRSYGRYTKDVWVDNLRLDDSEDQQGSPFLQKQEQSNDE